MILRMGELAALSTAVFWTITTLSFEFAAKRIGVLSLNLLRLMVGLTFLTLYSLVFRGMVLPFDAPPSVWLWMGLSGLTGFVLGDIFLFRAFVLIGARISMLVYASVPPLTAIFGYLLLGEKLTPLGFLGMGITLAGISLVILQRGGNPESKKTLGFSHPLRGILYAFGGAVGQSLGLVLSKYGAPNFNPFAATQIRCLAGMIGFALVILSMNRGARLLSALKDTKAMKLTLLGGFFGPFLGVSLGLYAVQHTTAGIASTIMALVPVLIIVPSIVLFKEKVTLKEAFGAFIAVGGVAFLFLS
jgi:drug/metabolite transporter (DMT)-like permease